MELCARKGCKEEGRIINGENNSAWCPAHFTELGDVGKPSATKVKVSLPAGTIEFAKKLTNDENKPKGHAEACIDCDTEQSKRWVGGRCRKCYRKWRLARK